MTKMASILFLEEELSRPSGTDRAFMRGLEGDLLVLGAGGKMGPSLATGSGVPRAKRPAARAWSSPTITPPDQSSYSRATFHF
jgi:hypothetical protein